MAHSYYGAAMYGVSVPHRSIVSAGFAGAILLVASLVSPTHAAAQAATIQTSQLIPAGQGTCQQLSIINVAPHVYDGTLESFDVTVSDNTNSYVGILATVNNSGLPLDFITRWAGESGGLRFHVDVPETPVYSGVPVTLTLIASPAGQPTCIANISFQVDAAGNTVAAPAAGSTAVPSASPAGGVTGSGATSAKPHHIARSSHPRHTPSTSSQLVGAGIAAPHAPTGLGAICADGANAYKIWFVLLVLYIVAVMLIVFVEPWFLKDSVLASTGAVLLPLILLLAFWYFSEGCRAASWIPVSACVIAIIGLFLAFREYETTPLLTSPGSQA